MTNVTTTATPTTTAADYQTLVGLLSALQAANIQIDNMQQAMNVTLHSTAEAVRVDHATAQETVATLEAKIEEIAGRHPEWFTKRKSIATPCGEVKQTVGTSLETDSEDVSIALVEERHPELCRVYVRQTKKLNRAALAALTDEELAPLKIRRVRTESIIIESAKVDLGKTVAAAAGKGAA